MIYANLWGSIIKLSQELITTVTNAGVGTPQLLDWEAHANIQELPNADLIGPTTLGFIEEDKVISVSFAMAASSYNDVNLFRHRAMMGHIFERLRPEMRIPYYDANTAQVIDHLIITDGTTLAPMSQVEPRPWQLVMVQALLGPAS
jgi:hypothetical protein